MTKEQMIGLLGRPLTTVENENFEQYLNIGVQNLEQMTCLDLSNCEDTRTYDTREGYSTLFTDLFTDINEVKINGNAVSGYAIRQWNKRNGEWYNSLVFSKSFTARQSEVEVSAEWICVDCLPTDLQAVIAGLFGLIGKKQKSYPGMQSKQVEDFRITLKDTDLDDDFHKKYGLTIGKYSQCSIPNLQHGGC